jgi:hypothetical protein
MEGDNAYLCEELGKRVPAVKRTAIRTLPQMLCVHLKRFEFDYHNQTRHKLRDRWVPDAAGALVAMRRSQSVKRQPGVLTRGAAGLFVSGWQYQAKQSTGCAAACPPALVTHFVAEPRCAAACAGSSSPWRSTCSPTQPRA